VQRAESREQRAESREQRAESREQRAESREQRGESREERAESKGTYSEDVGSQPGAHVDGAKDFLIADQVSRHGVIDGELPPAAENIHLWSVTLCDIV
jgi:hypothetical protein